MYNLCQFTMCIKSQLINPKHSKTFITTISILGIKVYQKLPRNFDMNLISYLIDRPLYRLSITIPDKNYFDHRNLARLMIYFPKSERIFCYDHYDYDDVIHLRYNGMYNSFAANHYQN